MKRIKEVREIAESVGLTVISVEQNGHIKMVCETTEGRRFAYFTSYSPGDNRANKNLRADLRRYAMGGEEVRTADQVFEIIMYKRRDLLRVLGVDATHICLSQRDYDALCREYGMFLTLSNAGKPRLDGLHIIIVKDNDQDPLVFISQKALEP